MTRVNTVASALKRFLSREDSTRGTSSTPDCTNTHSCHPKKHNFKFFSVSASTRMAGSPTSISLTQPPKYPAAGSMKITDQVIEEVDEQMTITSLRAPEQRPTAQSLFMPPTGPPPPSNPVMVPTTNRSAGVGYTRTQSAVVNAEVPFTYPTDGDAESGFISSSAPPGTHIQTTPVGIYDIEIEDFDQAAPIEGSVTAGTTFLNRLLNCR